MIAIIKEKKWLISSIIAIIILLIAGAYLTRHNQKLPSKNISSQAVLVQTLTVKSQSLPITATSSGYLKAIEDTTITSRVNGYIQAIPFQSGAHVKKGQTLFQLDNTREEEALQAAKANDALSQFQYKRNKMLLKKGYITEDQCYTSKVTMQQNASALQTAQTNLTDKTVTAPFNGTLGAIAISIGDYVAPGTKLSRLVNTQQLQIDYSLPAKDLNKVQLNQPVTIISDASKTTKTAYVSYIAPTIDTNTQTIHLEATINNKEDQFKPGEFVTINQQLGTNQQALLVPEQSILGAMNGNFVYIDKHQKAKQVPVTIGNHYHDLVEVTSGLKPGAQVIIAGQDEVHDGQAIKIFKK